MCIVSQKSLLFLLSTVICAGYLFHCCLLYCVGQNTTHMLLSILSKATNVLQLITKYLRVL